MYSVVKNLLNESPSLRYSAADVLTCPYFQHNPYRAASPGQGTTGEEKATTLQLRYTHSNMAGSRTQKQRGIKVFSTVYSMVSL